MLECGGWVGFSRKGMSLNQLCECGMRNGMGWVVDCLMPGKFMLKGVSMSFLFPKFDRRASTQMPWEIKTVSLNHINV